MDDCPGRTPFTFILLCLTISFNIIIKSLQHRCQFLRRFYICFMTCFQKLIEVGIAQITGKFL